MKSKNRSLSFLFSLYRCVRNAVVNTINHDGIEHAGYLAFLGLLSMFPFLVFLASIVGLIGQGGAGATFITDLLQALPYNVAEALRPRVTEIVSGPPQGLLTVSILGAIWTASSAVEGLRTILNRAYHVATPPAYWLRRGLSILQLILFTFIVIAAMLTVVLIPLSLQYLEGWLGINFTTAYKQYWSALLFFASIPILFLAICSMYYLLPNIKQSAVSIMPGAAIVLVGWLASARLFTYYLAHFPQLNLIYGSLGGIIAALIFFYICNVIFIFGAEFNFQVVHAVGLRVTEREKS